jgi:putative MATE family efflux protein
MDIYYLCFGLMVIPMVGNSAIRATGDTKWPSILMIVGGLMNVVLDPILIFGYGPVPAMGVQGAALATAGSWLIGFFAGFYLLYVREQLITLIVPPMAILRQHWLKMLRTGVPISLANMMTPVATAALTAFVAQYGEIAVAGLGAGNRIEAFSLVIPFAITAALSPFMSQNLGAGNIQRAHESLVLCVKFILKFQFAVFLVFVGGAWWLAQIFSSDPEIVKVARIYLWIMPLGLGFYGIIIVLNTAFNAQHQSEKTLLLSLVRVLLLYIPLAWAGGHLFGIPGIFIGATLGNGIAALCGWFVYKATRMQPNT